MPSFGILYFIGGNLFGAGLRSRSCPESLPTQSGIGIAMDGTARTTPKAERDSDRHVGVSSESATAADFPYQKLRAPVFARSCSTPDHWAEVFWRDPGAKVCLC